MNTISYHVQGYMVSLFNRFDFFVVCSSILEYTLVKCEVRLPPSLPIPLPSRWFLLSASLL